MYNSFYPRIICIKGRNDGYMEKIKTEVYQLAEKQTYLGQQAGVIRCLNYLSRVSDSCRMKLKFKALL